VCWFALARITANAKGSMNLLSRSDDERDLKIVMIVQLDHERGPWKATQSCGGLGSRQIGAPQQMGNRGGRLVDQKLLVAIEHFIAHRSDERVSLALAVRAQGAQPL
jgi:hypothetical protein